MKKYQFLSVGKHHPEEERFFKFLVQQEFFFVRSRVIEWCTFDGLTVTIDAACNDVVIWGQEILEKGFETETGYKYILTNT